MTGDRVPAEHRARLLEEWRGARVRYESEHILPVDALLQRAQELTATEPEFAAVLEQGARQILALAVRMRHMSAAG